MVDRETCIATINKFIKSYHINDLMTLFVYLCEIKELPNIDEAIKTIGNNPSVLSMIEPKILEELEIALKINRVVDKNNNLILVF